ncbi:MAG: hypothetical protein WCB85_14045 [Candidatus Dormiibacterota bacterium]
MTPEVAADRPGSDPPLGATPLDAPEEAPGREVLEPVVDVPEEPAAPAEAPPPLEDEEPPPEDGVGVGDAGADASVQPTPPWTPSAWPQTWVSWPAPPPPLMLAEAGGVDTVLDGAETVLGGAVSAGVVRATDGGVGSPAA